MRARNIKPGLFKNEILGSADPLLTLLFTGLWCLADREGRLEDRPLRVKAEVFPYRESLDIHRYLTELEQMGFIQRYDVQSSGDTMHKLKVIQVVNFSKHQSPHHTEKKSQLPPPVSSPIKDGGYREQNGEYPPDSLIPDLPNTENHSATEVVLNASASSKRGSRIPETFAVTEEHVTFAREHGLPDPTQHVAAFRDYWRAQPGSKGVKLDWDATFRNWLRRTAEFAGSKAAGKNSRHSSFDKVDYTVGLTANTSGGYSF